MPDNLTNKPVWVDLAASDAQAARDFYAGLFGWQIDVNEDPQYGGYGLARLNGKDVAGIGGKQSPDQPTVWSLYIGTDDLDALAQRVGEAGGNVIVPPFAVGDQGRMAVFQDPVGAFISAWEATTMRGFGTNASNTFGWAELNARGIENALPFYERVFGWTTSSSPSSEEPGAPPYYQFEVGGESILGAIEMQAEAPAELPSHWLVYFNVEDVDGAARKAADLGGQQVVPPQDFPGGRFAIVTDPEGATFGLLRYTGG